MRKSEFPDDSFLYPLICDRPQQPYMQKNLLFCIVRQYFVNDTGSKVWQNGKVWHEEDAFRKCFYASDLLFEWPRRVVWGNDLWHVHLNFKVLVHKMVLLTSFHIFGISRNLVKLKLYIGGQHEFFKKDAPIFYQIFSRFQVLLNQG